MGFGNNVITLAKAYLISQSCRMTYLPPVWPPCKHVAAAVSKGYGYYFPSSLCDRLKLSLADYQYRIQRKLRLQLWPTLSFDPRDYAQTGVIDIGDACLVYLKNLGLDDPNKSVVLTTSGMWGGYAAIRRARSWISNLLESHADTRKRLTQIEQHCAGRLRIAVQIRMSDFVPRASNGAAREGERGVRLPLEWYTRICRLIRQVCDCNFVLLSDGTGRELSAFLDEFKPVNSLNEPYSDLLDLLLLSKADLALCSNSTYARIGCFLNDRPYIWPADTLVKDPSGRYGYLWNDGGNPVRHSNGSDHDAIRRCFALPINVCSLPTGLRRYLASNGTLPIEIPDDLLYRDAAYLFDGGSESPTRAPLFQLHVL
jgi:hypothetical protein